MPSQKSVFEKSYEYYISQVGELPLASIASRIGVEFVEGRLSLPLFDRTFLVSSVGIAGPEGRRPSYDVCVILSRYLLLFPEEPAQGKNWVSFRDFKDSRPLHNYFAHDIEGAMAAYFSGRIDVLRQASAAMGGYQPELEVAYDLAVQFDALPMIPVVLLFNDAEEDFPAGCTILFPARMETYLDAECIAMVGSHLFGRLKKQRLQITGA
jgi:hypothetical protein